MHRPILFRPLARGLFIPQSSPFRRRAHAQIEAIEGRVLLSSSFPSEMVAVGDRLFFIADDGVHGRELWVSDGSSAGTRLVRDINPGSFAAEIRDLTPFGNRLAFAANDGAHGMELWITDGTTAGTTMVADIQQGTQSGFPTSITAIGDRLYFGAATNQFGRELWRSDGTAAGTTFIKDIYQGSIGSAPSEFMVAGGTLFFVADSMVTTGQGSHSTTTYFGRELWKTDGTAAGTVMVKDIRAGFGESSPSELTNINGTLFFRAYTDNLGWELYRSNGTASGTVLVEDINPTFRSSNPSGLREHDDLLYFFAIDGEFNQDLWRSDGTAAGTNAAANFAPGFTGFFVPSNFMNLGQSIVFATVGQSLGLELWRTDATAGGTFLIQQLIPADVFQNNPYRPSFQGQAGAKVFYTAIVPQVGMELHVTDGTLGGTMLLRDIMPGAGEIDPVTSGFTAVGNRVFFVANDGVHGSELWTSDGTIIGTRMVKDIFASARPPKQIRLATPEAPAQLISTRDLIPDFAVEPTVI